MPSVLPSQIAISFIESFGISKFIAMLFPKLVLNEATALVPKG